MRIKCVLPKGVTAGTSRFEPRPYSYSVKGLIHCASAAPYCILAFEMINAMYVFQQILNQYYQMFLLFDYTQ